MEGPSWVVLAPGRLDFDLGHLPANWGMVVVLFPTPAPPVTRLCTLALGTNSQSARTVRVKGSQFLRWLFGGGLQLSP